MAPRTEPRRRSRGFGESRVHGDVQGARKPAWEMVYELVRRIPRGRVMTYGQIATSIENRLSARAVGWALHGCPEDVPWQRVVNASGYCSTERIPDIPPGLQRSLLRREKVKFDENDTLDLTRYRWVPPEHRPRSDRAGDGPATVAKRSAKKAPAARKAQRKATTAKRKTYERKARPRKKTARA